MKKIKNKLKATETRADIYDKIGGAGGGSSKGKLSKKQQVEKLKINNEKRIGSRSDKQLTKLFDELMNPKPRKTHYSQLTKGEKTALRTGKGNYSRYELKSGKPTK